MGDIADHAISNKKRDYPAWGYLLGGGALGGLGVWFVLAEVFEDSRRPYLPWLMIGVSLWVIAYGVREWTRNGSLTARRVKSVEERERDERANRRLMKWQAARFALAVGFLLVILVVALFR